MKIAVQPCTTHQIYLGILSIFRTISYFNKEGKLVVSSFICSFVQLDDIVDTGMLSLRKIAWILEFFLNWHVKS
jgi:hypothetical protein